MKNDDNSNDSNDTNNTNENSKKVKQTFAHVIALSVSLVVELTSIQLSSLALKMSRETAYSRAGNTQYQYYYYY